MNINKPTICSIVLSLAINGAVISAEALTTSMAASMAAGIIGAGAVIGTSAACSGANYYSSSPEDRPEKPEFIVHKPNILEINTNGYDINLESYLRGNRTTVVEFSAWWCGPCTSFKHHALQKWPSDLDLIIVDLDYRLPKGESISSPAWRYVEQNGGKALPFFLLYKGKKYEKEIPFSGMGCDELFEEARRL